MVQLPLLNLAHCLCLMSFALGKKRSWTDHAEAQGETFHPPAIEAGGAINGRFRDFPVAPASSAFPFTLGTCPFPHLHPKVHSCGYLRLPNFPWHTWRSIHPPPSFAGEAQTAPIGQVFSPHKSQSHRGLRHLDFNFDFYFFLVPQPVLITSTGKVAWPQGDHLRGGPHLGADLQPRRTPCPLQPQPAFRLQNFSTALPPPPSPKPQFEIT